ncbi:MAG TPA: acyl-CoA dehydrogenase [Cyclobacteriaceae bacterium]
MSSSLLEKNPRLYIFLPLLYMVWEDAVLTPSEIKTMQDLIEKQDWLTSEEIDFLSGYLNPSQPPSPQELKEWLEEFSKIKLSADTKTLSEIGIELAKKNGAVNGNEIDEKIKSDIMEIENVLGIISRESIFNFYPEKRKTFTASQKTEQTFTVEKLAEILDGSQRGLIKKIKLILSDPEFRYFHGDNLQARREKVLEWSRLLAKQGFGALAYPGEYGGKNDMEAYFTVMETLSYHDLSLVIKFGVQFGLWGMSVYLLGTEKHHKKYLKKIGTLELPGCFAMTETNHGSNVKGIETTATYHHTTKTITINTPHHYARKNYIGNAACHGQAATVFAKLIIEGKDYGVNAFVVPLRDEAGNTLSGITIEDCGRKMGLNGVDNGIIHFDNVQIPLDEMLNRFATINEHGVFESLISSDNRRFFTMLGTLVGGRIGIPRAGLSAAKSGLTIAIRYADQRLQFGPEGATEVPILNYRTHQRRLMPLIANAYALHFALQYLTKRFLNRTEEEMQEVEALAAGLKAFATWNTTATLQECRECCGGKGYMTENRIDDLKNDTDIFTTFEGDNTVLMQLVAKSRLTEFKQEFGSMNLFGILNYVIDQAATSFMELNPIIVRKTDAGHLLDPEFHLDAFIYRERDILTSAARRLRKHLDNGMDSFDAFNQTQYHMVNVGFAYVERIILEQFQVAVKNTKDKGCKNILQKLCNLFALSQLEKNKGWYLEHGYMEGVKTKAIRKLINQLVWEIRQEAVPLVNAFEIPDSCLSAPIAIR